jgi:hypothetical protein
VLNERLLIMLLCRASCAQGKLQHAAVSWQLQAHELLSRFETPMLYCKAFGCRQWLRQQAHAENRALLALA